MASTSKGQQKKGKNQGRTLPIINTGGDSVKVERAVPFSVTQALQNDLVLDNIFSYLAVSDLKSCRQVCQQWKQATRRIFVEKCNPVGFRGTSLFFEESHRIGEMAKLTSVISTSNGFEFPVTMFLVGADMTDLSDGQEEMDIDSLEEILRDFFQAIAPLATQLEIGFIDTAKVFQSDAPLNIEFSRLKTLKLKLICFTSGFLSVGNIIRSNLAFYQNILENAPQLSTLDILVAGAYPETLDLLINLMERTVFGRKISTLNLDASFRDNHFDRLAGIGLKLTSLRLNLASNSSLKEVGEGWMNFLKSQGDTLENLHVQCDGWRRNEELTVGFPRLRKLKSLTLGSYYDNEVKFSGMFYAKQFPVLEQLSLGPDRSSSLETLLSSDMPPIATVEILKLPYFLIDPVWVWHAARIFPNVKKLEIPGRIGIVQAVFQAWQNVEELTITGDGFGESANELLAANFQGVLPSNYRLKTSGKPTKFLQDLKILRLEDFDGSAAPTTPICHFVFLKMGSLKCLDLSKCNDPQSKISKSVLTKMRKKFLVLC